jgi:hypothetical protein
MLCCILQDYQVQGFGSEAGRDAQGSINGKILFWMAVRRFVDCLLLWTFALPGNENAVSSFHITRSKKRNNC